MRLRTTGGGERSLPLFTLMLPATNSAGRGFARDYRNSATEGLLFDSRGCHNHRRP